MLLIWRRWRGWRRGRPFWGGLFTVLAGVEIGVLPLAPMKVMLHEGTAGIPAVVLAAIMVVLGFSGWFTPQYRGLAGIITVMLAASALVLSNLGGFMIGTLLGVVGGALMFAWRPVPPPDDAGVGDGTAAEGGEPAAFHAEAVPVAAAVPASAEAAGAPEGDSASARSGAADGPPAAGGAGVSGASGERGASGPADPSGPNPAEPSPNPPGTSGTSRASGTGGAPSRFESADSSLAAAFGVDDDPFPPRRGDTSRPKGQD
ncbi:DUF6114 domain-containing protein [Streptomyces winkii]|uniref:DUF6114 domain-containing protein n=1 Tax=Streptomyces winkii TaxID=3051178 RepID=UPI0028D1AE5B|nr:DUF6114 domain-containing protein [Streptomyces sp. DSM 40971]